MKKLQVELEIESKCLNFPDQFSCHYSAFLNLCPLLLSTYCVYLEYQVRVGGMGHLEPLSRESLIPAQRTHTHTHTHRGFKTPAQPADWVASPSPSEVQPRKSAFFLTFGCSSPQHRLTGRKGKM